MFPMQYLSVFGLLSFADAEAGKSWGDWQLRLVYLALFGLLKCYVLSWKISLPSEILSGDVR